MDDRRAAQPPAESVMKRSRTKTAATVLCPGCRAPNPEERKFCSQCGKNLWDTCFQCGALVTASDRFCGACGADLVGGIASQAEAVRHQLATAMKHLKQAEYDAAIQILTPLADIQNTALRPLVEQARQQLHRAQEERKQRQAEIAALEGEVGTLLARQQYRQVVRKLEAVPAALRTAKLNRQLAEALDRLQEIESLSAQLRQSAGAPFSLELVRTVGRLLALDPQHAHARQTMSRLSRHAQRAAQELLAEQRYDQASRLLEHVPPQARSAEIEELRARAAELASMVRVLQSSPAVTPALVALAQRFAQLAPQDPRARQWISARATSLPHNSGDPICCTPAGRPPDSQAAGPPVFWLAGLPGVSLGPQLDDAALAQHPGRFAVACGLALQGLGIGSFLANLLPDEASFWQKAWRRLNERPPRTAWGLDLGTAALKAIKLVRTGRHTPPQVVAADLVEHRKPLSQTAGAEEMAVVAAESFAKLATRNDLACDRLCLGLPQPFVCVRRLAMPLLPPDRLRAAVALEARSQFPVPMDDLVWDYVIAEQFRQDQPGKPPAKAVLEKRKTAGRSQPAASLAGILVPAVKRLVAKTLLLGMQGEGIRPDVLQVAPLALANLLAWSGFREALAGTPSPGPVVAALDIGYDGMNFVVTAPGLVWLRSAGLGASRAAHFLARQQQVPLARAEQWLRNPAEAESPASVLATMDSVFDDYCHEARASLEEFESAHPQNHVRQILLVGGGAMMLGLQARLAAALSYRSKASAP